MKLLSPGPKRFAGRIAGALSLVLAIALAAGCQHEKPQIGPIPPAQIPNAFSDADWATVLTALTTPDGYVKWNDLQGSEDLKAALRRYIGLINAVSPENHPNLFVTDGDRRAYWINAYSAMCVYAVFELNYPANLLAGPAPAAQTPAGQAIAGQTITAQRPGAIFSTMRFSFGGKAMTLNALVREKLDPAKDPRVLFALSFCTASGPPLRSTPYDGAVLDAELVDQGQRYLSDPRAAVRDGDAVKLNDLFMVMHRDDFLAGFQKMFGAAPKGILEALQPYVQSDSPIVGAKRAENLGFDWSLNRPPR
jgi:hypothetical protein